jgi:ABC-type antimicrobial peptide transport system permease subunit
MAIGANASSIARLVLGEGLQMVLSGAAIGVVLSLVLSRVLSSQLYGVANTDPLTFAAAVVILVTAGVAAVASPVASAVRVDPASAMRVE